MNFNILLEAIRPHTLPLALAAIFCGNALGFYMATVHGEVFVCSLVTAVLLQVLSNLANDYGDGVKQTDTDRQGPRRMIASGLMSLTQMRVSLVSTGVLALLSGLVLLAVSQLTINEILVFILLGGVAIFAAITYTMGKNPYGYHALGEVAVLLFFGLVAVAGSFYLQAHALPMVVLLPAIGCGLWCAAVLNINNMRDLTSDKQAGKTTVAVLLGNQKSHYFHASLLGIGLLSYLLFIGLMGVWQACVILLVLPWLRAHWRRITQATQPSHYAPELKVMTLLTFTVNTLFAIALVMSRQ